MATLVTVTVAALLAATGLAGCHSDYAGPRLRIATGSKDGVYYQLGDGLAKAWVAQTGMPQPQIETTAGAPDDIARLHAGTADVGFGAADAITDTESGPHRLRALARIYDDYIQVVVRADLPITNLADLRGRTVALGPAKSQVTLVAQRILDAAGVTGYTPVPMTLDESIAALREHTIDAFFWSGGVPTQSIATLGVDTGIRLLNLGTDPSNVLRAMVSRYHVYGTAVIPLSAYPTTGGSVTTLVVPNFLLVTDALPDNVAEELTRGLFDGAPQLARLNPAALAIDERSAIYTEPVPLAGGALTYYRLGKN